MSLGMEWLNKSKPQGGYDVPSLGILHFLRNHQQLMLEGLYDGQPEKKLLGMVLFFKWGLNIKKVKANIFSSFP